jgi:hypothetical protein
MVCCLCTHLMTHREVVLASRHDLTGMMHGTFAAPTQPPAVPPLLSPAPSQLPP